MNFVSYVFLAFYGVVFSLYWLLPHRKQNLLLLIASYVFYGWWDWRFLSLIIFSSIFDFVCGKLLAHIKSRRSRQLVLSCSIVANIGLLGIFKYFDFFSASFGRLCSLIGWNFSTPLLSVMLPVGISFYTFQTLSYTIDVYRGQLKPTHRLLDFMLYVSFFPQLVAGPIERARSLLPQILLPRTYSGQQVASGMTLALIGFFKKMVISDNMAVVVDSVYEARNPDGLAVLIGTWCFAFQIYCDFSGYTDIARGISRMLGIHICENFRLPYFAVSPSEFWQRWHISLSTWLRDYVYVPLGGNRNGYLATLRNLMITMLLGGLWHGASGHFIVWGAYHGGLLILYRVVESRSRRQTNVNADAGITRWLQAVIYFQLTCLGWLLFRAETTSQAADLFLALFQFGPIMDTQDLSPAAFRLVFLAVPLICFQVYQFQCNRMEPWQNWPVTVQAVFYSILFYLIVVFGSPTTNEFIYFQF